jgi:demethylmenaquinone methyltransferase/2-methoxy-6-polyprenyl-1,4-benzoquinol methylase
MTYYDEISEGYEELHKEEQEKKIALIKKYIKVDPDDLLLDVGCGTGLTTEPWDCKKIGIDPAKKLIEKAKAKKTKTRYLVAEAENIPFEDNKFDIVISITTIQNFHDIEKGLSEIKRVGKDRFVLSFLKKSARKEQIERLIRSMFKVEKLIEEEKDLLFFCVKQQTI